MTFIQDPPKLGNQYEDDRLLRSYLARVLPEDVRREIVPGLAVMGGLAGGRLAELSMRDRLNEPRHVPFDPWGNRIDHIELTQAWHEAKKVACEHGLVAIPYERRHGEHSRIHQAALIYLFHCASDTYTCPLAMSDGAAKTLVSHGNAALADRALPRLTSRDPAKVWTSGQWMTERTGGSDVGLSECVARRDGDRWRLSGVKWFTSAATSEMALTLARPEGNAEGGRGLALFYVEMFDEQGRRNEITIHRLKEKLGTRKLPTAELELHGSVAIPVTAKLGDGVKSITPMLNITRTWNSICAASGMRRGVALARDYSRRRRAFGANLAAKPLHLDTLAWMQAELEAAFHLTMLAVELIGREEAKTASAEDLRLLRLVTPIAKLTTGKQAIPVVSEAVEVFAGAGYCEDTGLPWLLRDTHVLPIWEGTTNVLSLEALKAIQKEGALQVLLARAMDWAKEAKDPALADAARKGMDALGHAATWLRTVAENDLATVEAGARRFALTLGRATELVLLARHGQWSLEHEKDGRAAAAAVRFARSGIDLLVEGDRSDAARSKGLALDEPLPSR